MKHDKGNPENLSFERLWHGTPEVQALKEAFDRLDPQLSNDIAELCRAFYDAGAARQICRCFLNRQN